MTRSSWWIVVAVTLGAYGCTKPNPRSCADGLCSDPSRPFCDVDGALEGTPEVCVPVSCTQGEFIACRDDEVIRCNASGNNYDLVACQRGCSEAEAGCISCSSNTDCVNPAPICDTTAKECRGCRSDAECTSQVCALESGACRTETEVVYSSPAGGASAACTLADPCSVARAVTVVSTSATGKTLRMLPGTYAAPIVIQGGVVNIVATGATLGTTSGLSVIGGATVEFRGIAIRSSELSGAGGKVIVCGDSSASIPKSSLTLSDSILAVSSPATAIQSLRCNLRIEQSDLTALQIGLSLNTDSTFEGDRLHVHAAQASGMYLSTSGLRASMRVTNSLLENTYVTAATADTVAPGSPTYFAFNTFVYTTQDGGQACDYSTSYVRDIRFENNIFFASSSTNVTFGADWTQCRLANNVLFPQAAPRINNVVADPKFVDLAAKNYGLQATSPAVNAAVPSTGLATDHDFDGVLRPQGAAPDIGAFERTP